jgi:hypothetical protein
MPGSQPTDVDLSIVVDHSTTAITGHCNFRPGLQAWIEQARAAPVRCEVVVASGDREPPRLEPSDDVPVRLVQVEGGTYYALKNAGVNAARGAIILCTDGDCLPSEGYVTHLLRAFEDPAVCCIEGVSNYDGDGLLTRLNTAHSWGFVHRGQMGLDRHMILAHNVAFRRAVVARDPFGPFPARVGGDRYLTESLRRQGHRIVHVEGMRLRHEDITFSFRGTLERHLRELLLPVPYGTPGQRFSLAFTLASLVLRPILRLVRVFQARHALGLRPRHTPIVLAVNVAYAIFDAGAVLVVLLVPSLRRWWMEFLIGPAAGADPGVNASLTALGGQP